jgi:hypothetical protein
MSNIIRPTLPREFSIGILIIIFILTAFLSPRIFSTTMSQDAHLMDIYVGIFLVSTVVIIDILILWEEILFPIHVNPLEGEVIFRNHRNKLKIQALFYLIIPVLIGIIYFNFEINPLSFYPWAGICLVAPIVGKLATGINNYNDFLRLSELDIEYKNNEKEGDYTIDTIESLELIKDEESLIKLKLIFKDSHSLIIDLDEMELEEFYESIEKYINIHYSGILNLK